ncbi:MAG: hypothetical protein R3346_03020, partial [Candidatus Spechtbacterales bacterium]|nr:hypothetical protein [Candidatus Spechtbacterales bacterium]
MQPNSCLQLIPLYQAWKESTEELQRIKEEFLNTGDPKLKESFEQAKEKAEKARDAYKEASIIEVDGEKRRVIEEEVLELMGGVVGDRTRENKGDIAVVSEISFDQALDAKTITEKSKYIKYFKDLKRLDCYNTQIQELPELPDSLRLLYCPRTQIQELPELPDSLEELICDNTQIQELPELPDSLKTLICDNTQIQELPELPDSLEWLYCNSTQIQKLPELPDSLVWLDCRETP